MLSHNCVAMSFLGPFELWKESFSVREREEFSIGTYSRPASERRPDVRNSEELLRYNIEEWDWTLHDYPFIFQSYIGRAERMRGSGNLDFRTSVLLLLDTIRKGMEIYRTTLKESAVIPVPLNYPEHKTIRWLLDHTSDTAAKISKEYFREYQRLYTHRGGATCSELLAWLDTPLPETVPQVRSNTDLLISLIKTDGDQRSEERLKNEPLWTLINSRIQGDHMDNIMRAVSRLQAVLYSGQQVVDPTKFILDRVDSETAKCPLELQIDDRSTDRSIGPASYSEETSRSVSDRRELVRSINLCYKGVRVRASPFGIKGLSIENILTIDNLDLSDWCSVYRGWSRENARKMARLFIHRSIWLYEGLLYSSIEREHRVDIGNCYMMIANLPTLITALGYSVDGFRTYIDSLPSLPVMGAGALERTFRLRSLRHRGALSIPPKSYTVPYSREDLIPSDQFPLEIVSYLSQVVRSDPMETLLPPYREALSELLKAGSALGSASSLHARERFASLNLEEPQYLFQLLDQNPSRSDIRIEVAYYAACRGISLPFHLDLEGLIEMAVFLCEITDAGGLSRYAALVEDARPKSASSSASFQSIEGIMQGYSSELFREITKRMSPGTPALIAEWYGIDNSELIELPELEIIVRRGYLYPLPISEVQVTRFREFASFTSQQLILLSSVYADIDFTAVSYAKMKRILPTEAYAKVYTPELSSKIEEALQMVIPTTLEGINEEERFNYIVTALPAYEKIFSRDPDRERRARSEIGMRVSDILASYSDKEILRLHLKAKIGYCRRTDLIVGATRLLEGGKGFFVPDVRDPSLRQTPILFDDAQDLSLLLVGYGRLRPSGAYNLYSLHEISGSLTIHDGKVMRHSLVLPDGTREELSIYQLDSLRWLLRSLSPKMDSENRDLVTEIERKIDEISLALSIVSSDNVRLQRALEDFTSIDIDLSRRYLHKLFEIGMYMRRWDGPGHPYPLAARETRPGRGYRQNTALAPHIGSLHEIRAELSRRIGTLAVLDSLATVTVVGTTVTVSQGSPLWDNILTRVFQGGYCIRMASQPIVCTAAHYLRLLFRDEIPGFVATSVDPIA